MPKKLLVIITLLLLVFPPSVLSAPSLLRPGLQAFWPLGEASGTRFDSVTQGVGPAGQFTKANNEYLSIADNASLSVGDIDFSVAAWVYLDSKAASDPTIASKYDGTNNLREWRMNYDTTADRLTFTVCNIDACGSGVTVTANTFGSPPTATWLFIVAYHDSVNNLLSIQVNNGTANTAAYSLGGFDGTASFQIGAIQGSPTPFQLWDGRISLVGFWKKVLSAAERTELYNSGRGYAYRDLTGSLLTSLNAYWNLNEGSGTRYDSSGSNNLTDNNTVTQATGVRGDNSLGDNATVTQAAGPYRSAIAGQFTKANSEVLLLPDNLALSCGDCTLTLAAWVYIDSALSNGEIRFIAAKNSGVGSEYDLVLNDTDAGAGVSPRFQFRINGGANTVTASTFGAPSTGTWYLVIGTHRGGATDQLGIQVNNGTENTAATTVAPADGTNPFSIGGTGFPDNFWDGRIVKVGVWKKDLSATERTDLYNSGNGNLYDGTAFLVDTNGTLKTSLQAWWELDELAGTREDKVSPGKGPAAQFTAANSEYLSIADNASLSTGDIDFTIAGWFYFDSIGSNDTTIIQKGLSTAGNDEYSLYVQSNAFNYLISTDGSATGSCTAGQSCIVTDTTTLTTNTWYFVVAWYDSVARQIRIRVNDGTTVSKAWGSGPNDRTGQFTIAWIARGFRYFDGRSQLVGFWKKVLSAGEITSLYNSGSGLRRKDLSEQMERSLISYWDLNEGSGTRYDQVGANNLTDNATVTQATGVAGGNSLGDNNTVTHNRGLPYFDTAAVGNSAQFTAANSEYLSIADNASLRIAETDITLCAWVYPDSINERVIISKEAGGGGYQLSVSSTAGKLAFDFGVETVGSTSFNIPPLVTSVWYFVCGWHDAAENALKLQVNNGSVFSTPHIAAASETTGPFRIGTSATPDRYWDGRIARVFVTKRVLTQAERAALYNQGIGQTYQNLQREFRKRTFY